MAKLTFGNQASTGILGQINSRGIGASAGYSKSSQGVLMGGILEDENTLITKYEVYESKIDLLVLSCAWHRLRNSKNTIKINISSILNHNLFNELNSDDYALAQEIRNYYSKKIMLWTIKNVKMTKFRQDLSTFIQDDGKKFTEKMIGLAFTLPSFYEYDIKLDLVFSGKNFVDIEKQRGRKVKELTLIDKTIRDRKNFIKKYEYWFLDQSNTINSICIDVNNPLISIWDNLILKPVQIEGSFIHRNYDEFEYFRVDKFSIVFP